MLDERLQVQWELQGDWVQIQLAARIRDDQYMSFGLSGESGRSSMVGGDVVVAFYDTDRGAFRAEDYYMSATAQVGFDYTNFCLRKTNINQVLLPSVTERMEFALILGLVVATI